MKRSNSRTRAETNSAGAEHSRRGFLKASLELAGGATMAPLLSSASVQPDRKEIQARERIDQQSCEKIYARAGYNHDFLK
jgi:hypothetical protein